MFLEFWQTEEIDYSTVFVFYFCFCTFVFVYMFLANRGNWFLDCICICILFLFFYFCVCVYVFSKQRRLITGKSGKIRSLPPLTVFVFVYLCICVFVYLCICVFVFYLCVLYFLANRGDVDCKQVWRKLDLCLPLATEKAGSLAGCTQVCLSKLNITIQPLQIEFSSAKYLVLEDICKLWNVNFYQNQNPAFL